MPVRKGQKVNRPSRRWSYDPELGLTRYCPTCDEHWPADAEFWYVEPLRPTAWHCRACKAENRRRVAA